MLNRWDPFSELSRLQDEMRLFGGRGENREGFVPPVDIFEDKEGITVTAEVAGIRPEDIHITVENNILNLRGERKFEREQTRDGWRRVERSYGSFTRSFALPSTVATDKIEAQTKDGVLTLRLPKRAEAQPRRIEVRPGAQASEAKRTPVDTTAQPTR